MNAESTSVYGLLWNIHKMYWANLASSFVSSDRNTQITISVCTIPQFISHPEDIMMIAGSYCVVSLGPKSWFPPPYFVGNQSAWASQQLVSILFQKCYWYHRSCCLSISVHTFWWSSKICCSNFVIASAHICIFYECCYVFQLGNT